MCVNKVEEDTQKNGGTNGTKAGTRLDKLKKSVYILLPVIIMEREKERKNPSSEEEGLDDDVTLCISVMLIVATPCAAMQVPR